MACALSGLSRAAPAELVAATCGRLVHDLLFASAKADPDARAAPRPPRGVGPAAPPIRAGGGSAAVVRGARSFLRVLRLEFAVEQKICK